MGCRFPRRLQTQSGRDVALGSVYAALERLEDRGLVVSSVGDPTPERGGRAKRYFKVTGKGLEVVRGAQQTLTRMWKGLRALPRGRA